MVTKLKRLPTERERIFVSYKTDEGLITRIYRELKKLNFPKNNDPSELNRAISREEVQMVKNKMKICSTSLAIKGNKNQNHFKILPHSC
jgi:hypothetical protein